MLILYSVNTWLAFKISERYFNDKHYVWCSPLFNAKGVNPPSSDPYEIYNNLLKDVQGGDKHSSKIMANRTGLINGATQKKLQGLITQDDLIEIIEIVNTAELENFRPLIYIIPFYKIEPIVKPVSIKHRANNFSKEFIVEEMTREHFDVIDTFKN